MGVLDLVGKILVDVKYDTKDAKSALKELGGEEKKLAEQQLKAAESRNKGIEDTIKNLGRWTVALGAVSSVATVAFDGMKLGLERTRLETASMGTNIDKLRAASLALKTTTDLLRDATKFQSGEFKLTQKQMEDTERAMVALSRKFVDGGESSKKLMQAVTELKIDGLQELGIPIDKVGLSMDKAGDRAELFRRTMAKVAEVGRDVRDGQLAAGEGTEQATTQLRDSWEKLKIGLGQLATAFEPLIRALTSTLDALGSVGKSVSPMGMLSQYENNKQGWAALAKGVSLEGIQEGYGLRFTGSGFVPYTGPAATPGNAISALQSSIFGDFMGRGTAAAPGSQRRPFNGWVMPEFSVRSGGRGTYGSGGYLGLGEAAEDDAMGQFGSVAFTDLEKYAGPTNESRLEKMFGPLEEFNSYKMAFDSLSGAVTSALTAWIDGSMSAGEAVKKFISEALKGLAVQMAVEALKHGAYAIGSLAFGDVAGAATHGKAALAFGVASAAAAVGAKGLGGAGDAGGGASGVAGYSPGAPASPGRGTGSAPVQNNTIVIGNSFDRMSPRERSLEADRLVSEALGSSGGGRF